MRTAAFFLLLTVGHITVAGAQPNTISTYAGGGPVTGPALSMNVAPNRVAASPDGDAYFVSTNWHAVYKLSGGVVTLVAGKPGISGFSGDGGPATDAILNSPRDVAVDASRNIYIVDWNNSRIRKISATTGVITTVAGNGLPFDAGDGGPATSASLFLPAGVAVDARGNLYISEPGTPYLGVSGRIRKVSADTGVIATVAFVVPVGRGDDGPSAMAVDANGDVYFVHSFANLVRKVSATTGAITTVAGNGSLSPGYGGDNGPATSARLNFPSAVALDRSGNVYIADGGNNRIREVSVDTGVITTVAGGGSGPDNGDGGPATNASVSPSGVAVDGSGDIYISGGNRIREVSAATGLITTVAGNGSCCYGGDDGPATSASLYQLSGVAVDGSGDLYIADSGNNRIRKVSATTGVITTVAGGGSGPDNGDGGPATSASVSPSGVAVDGSGNVYIAESVRVRKVSVETGVITTVAGNGTYSYGDDIGDGGPAISASLSSANGVAVDGSGNIYIADTNNNRIRKVSADTGVITTIAGTSHDGYGGDGGPATSASLYRPTGVAVDGSGNVYIADTNDNRIRRVSPTTGVITTVAGNGGSGYLGDNGPATSANLASPHGVTVDGSGNVYIADTNDNRIRKVSAVTGVITTVAGKGGSGYSGDNGPATSASLASPSGVAVDVSRNIYIADFGNNRIRKVEHAISPTTILTSNANPTTTQNLVLTATAGPSDATGSVQFFDGTSSLGTVEMSAGTATLSGLLLTVGTHSLTALYSGDANYAASTSAPISQVISSRAFSTIALTSDGQPAQSDGQTVYVSTPNSPVMFTATVTPTAASGTVQFFDGPTRLGMQTFSGGAALFTTSSLALGNHTITAVYSGDALFMPRWSTPLTQQVQSVASANTVNTRATPR